MEYVVEYFSDPNWLQLRLMCLLEQNYVKMRSPEEVTTDICYGFVFRRWFAYGISIIELKQHTGFLLVRLNKREEKNWDQILPEIMNCCTTCKGWVELLPRETDPSKRWPLGGVLMQ